MSLFGLPKIELHVHLDCSLSFEVVQQLDPGIDALTYQNRFTVPGKCTDLSDYISRVDSAIDIMQTEEQLRLITLDLMAQLAADQVIYAEIRFAPLQHIKGGLAAAEVVQIVSHALEEGMAITGLEANLILCTLRHFNEAQSLATIKLVESFLDKRVVGFDIAADEAGFPIDAHKAAFAYARTHHIPCTAHAGEAKGAESVWETLTHLHPRRIGHGVRSIEDPGLVRHLAEQDIHLEVCPKSNVITSVVDRISDHPVDQLYKAKVSLSINTDGRSLVNTDLTSSYETLSQVFGWQKAHFLHCNLEAVRHAFISPELKKKLRAELLAAYG